MPRRAPLAVAGLMLVAAALAGCGTIVREVRRQHGFAAPPPSDLVRARTAWSYFADGAQVAEVSRGARFTTPTTLGDELVATDTAWRLGLIGRPELTRRVDRTLAFLARVPLSGGVVPGRFYARPTARLFDPATGAAADPGWSSVELARLLVALKLVGAELPEREPVIAQLVGSWRLCATVDAAGHLLQHLPSRDVAADTNSGYDAYAVRAYRLWGIGAAAPAAPAGDFTIAVEGIDIPASASGPGEPLMTVPVALAAAEFGPPATGNAAPPAQTAPGSVVVAVQARRAATTGILTARSDYRRDSAPYLVADTILGGNYPWSTLDAEGRPQPALALFSTRAAFALRVLDPAAAYPAQAVAATDGFRRPGGYIEGRYENGSGEDTLQSAATNAFVLEAVRFRQSGFPHLHASAARCPAASNAP